LSLLSSYFAGSNPAVRQKRIASGLDLSFGTQREYAEFSSVYKTSLMIRYHSAKGELPRHISRRNAKASLA
jgi:hypothetical protein